MWESMFLLSGLHLLHGGQDREAAEVAAPALRVDASKFVGFACDCVAIHAAA
eukprot:gene8787-6621_t